MPRCVVRLHWSLPGLAVFVLAAGGAQAVDAPDPTPPVLTPVYDMPRPDYDAPKLELGSWLVAPQLSQMFSYDDNIFASDRVEAEDALSTTSEEVSMRSQWSRHAVTGRAFFSQQIYHDHSIEDANVFGVEGGGRYDISGDASLNLTGSFIQQPQQRDSPQADLAFIGRPIYNTITGALGYNQQWGRFQNQAQFGVTKTAYTSADDFGRNGTELRTRDRVSFALTGQLWPFVEGAYSTQYWLRNSDLRNYNTLSGTLGLRAQIADLLQGEVGIGVLRQQFRNDNFESLVTPVFHGEIDWNVLPLTTISASADRTVMGLENFCDRALTPASCAALAGLSVPDILQFLNGQTGCSGDCAANPAGYYANLLGTVVIPDLRYNYIHGLGLPSGLASYPGLSLSGAPNVKDVLDVAKQLQQLLLRYSQGTSGGIAGDQRGSLEVTKFSLGVQHEFWHDFLAEVKFRFEEDRFDPVALVDRNYMVNVNGRFLVNQNLELDLSYTHAIRDANQDIVLYNSGPYSENLVSLTAKAAF